MAQSTISSGSAFQVDITDLPTGNYYLKLFANAKVETIKFTKG